CIRDRLFDFLGFMISTFLFLEALMLYISKAKKMLWPTVIAMLFAVGIYVVFGRVLGITLPPGRILDLIGG
ncbi:MAG: tripartite tricarboxylate transporter TctB family protein, partial [Rectinema sp.]|nr:tripartite tricarboxylate transporter TctB family protein [Rectinema sp.]